MPGLNSVPRGRAGHSPFTCVMLKDWAPALISPQVLWGSATVKALAKATARHKAKAADT